MTAITEDAREDTRNRALRVRGGALGGAGGAGAGNGGGRGADGPAADLLIDRPF